MLAITPAPAPDTPYPMTFVSAWTLYCEEIARAHLKVLTHPNKDACNHVLCAVVCAPYEGDSEVAGSALGGSQ
jgi:hypothetical protein